MKKYSIMVIIVLTWLSFIGCAWQQPRCTYDSSYNIEKVSMKENRIEIFDSVDNIPSIIIYDTVLNSVVSVRKQI